MREGVDAKPSAKAWWTPPRTLWDHNGQRVCVSARGSARFRFKRPTGAFVAYGETPQTPQAKKDNLVLVGENTVKPDGAPQAVSDGGAVLLWEILDWTKLKRKRYADSFQIPN